MGNLIDIQTQIEKLQKQATEIKTREFAKTVKEIQAKMQAFGITLKDLQLAPSKRRKGSAGKEPSAKKSSKATATRAGKRARKPSAQAGKKVAPKFRGPKGEVWSGRGMTPRWLAALEAQGKARESFAIKG